MQACMTCYHCDIQLTMHLTSTVTIHRSIRYTNIVQAFCTC